MPYYGRKGDDDCDREFFGSLKEDQEYFYSPPTQYDLNQERLALQAYKRYLNGELENDVNQERLALQAYQRYLNGEPEDDVNQERLKEEDESDLGQERTTLQSTPQHFKNKAKDKEDDRFSEAMYESREERARGSARIMGGGKLQVSQLNQKKDGKKRDGKKRHSWLSGQKCNVQ
ncbi:hypothetical protein N3K66_000889 [Trichothecium roseum]|uniref:Uncharacterized protein n=1 Tax=Trichothecium roseum TaxID=47278 RepID=A0ACC0VD63_9HYPO|nr:hypothetical protein N3K66_000889 [Trichothecium roseum]